MKIQNSQLYIQKTPRLSSQIKRDDNSVAVENKHADYFLGTSKIPFTGMNRQIPKKMDIDSEIKKLIKYINEILEFDTSDLTEEEKYITEMRNKINLFREKLARKQRLIEKIIELEDNIILSPRQKLNLIEQYRRENLAIDRFGHEQPKKPQSKKNVNGDKLDFLLLNKLKSEIQKGNFNLLKVYKEYYGALADTIDLKELQKRYPKIKLPKRPEDVIAKKLLDTLTKDFYEQLEVHFDKKDTDAFYDLSDSVIQKLCQNISKKYNVDFISTYEKLSEKLHTAILQNFSELKTKDSFANIPKHRKIKEPQITQTDIDMLNIDFEDFVKEVLNRQYLGSEKLNDIVYVQNGKRIAIRSLSNTDYKFEKASERIRQVVTTGEKIKTAQRDYNSFNSEELQKRLEHFSNKKSGTIDEIFAKIMDFHSCRFEPDDRNKLIKFLQRLDEFEDGDISLKNLKDHILDEDLKPIGTENLNNLERQQHAEKMKLEQRKAFELASKQEDFDNIISILYENDMPTVAASCLKYRPQSLEPQMTEDAQYIVNIINNEVKSANGKPINKSKIEAEISHFDTYKYYKDNKATNETFKKALQFATKSDGSLDIDKAGQYINNAELVENYPDSKAIAKYPIVLEKIMERVSSNDEAIKYLFKFDEFATLANEDKAKIEILDNLFDCNDNLQKQLLKYIIEEHYAKSNTTILTKLSEKGEETIESVFHPEAKQKIIEKYKFPVCMEYLQAFEDALKSTSGGRAVAGIKITGTNNKALEYKMEVKIKNHDDRLFSSKNNYIFDIFSPRGLH